MALQPLEVVISCHLCDNGETFSSKQKLRIHYSTSHSITLTTSLKGRPQKRDRNLPAQSIKDEKFECPCCEHRFAAIEELGMHINIHSNIENSQENFTEDNSDTESLLTDIKISTRPTISNDIFKTEIDTYRRPYDEAILHSCQQLDKEASEKNKTLWIINNMELEPFSVISNDGVEQNGLTHKNLIADVTDSHQKNTCEAIALPKKRKWSGDSSTNTCSFTSDMNMKFKHLLQTSPYKRKLLQHQYVEMNDAIGNILNQDWDIYPQTRYASSQLLAGAIFYNNISKEAILINTVEVYGRRKSIDSHRESFKNLKGGPPETSIPPPVLTKYVNVWPTIMHDNDGKKLVLGTQIFNALVTSAIRIDIKDSVSLGSVICNFDIRNANESLHTSIYLDKGSADKAIVLNNDDNCKYVEGFNMLYQLRQVRTKFHMPSTYLLCRASSFFSLSHNKQPYTIYTLLDCDNSSEETDGYLGSLLFKTIAVEVLKKGDEGILNNSAFQKLYKKCKGAGLKKLFDKIEDLFISKKVEHLNIIGNKELSMVLQPIADHLASYVAIANGKIAESIVHDMSSM